MKGQAASAFNLLAAIMCNEPGRAEGLGFTAYSICAVRCQSSTSTVHLRRRVRFLRFERPEAHQDNFLLYPYDLLHPSHEVARKLAILDLLLDVITRGVTKQQKLSWTRPE